MVEDSTEERVRCCEIAAAEWDQIAEHAQLHAAACRQIAAALVPAPRSDEPQG